jgi:hypothetical protein
MTIFKEKELKDPTFFQKLFKKQPEENALIEINNLLAKNQDNLMKITLDNILEIGEKYKIDLKSKDQQLRIDLYSKYLDHSLKDKKIDKEDITVLEHLKQILLLNDYDTQKLLKAESEKIYSHSVKESIVDGELDELEKANLEILRNELLIPEEIAKEIFEDKAKEVYKKFIDGTISDERVTPQQELELVKIARSLGVDHENFDYKRNTFEKYKLYWQIENADLPVLNSDINLQNSESLHFKSYIDWLEQRRVTKRINYGGPTARIKIMKGVYYRVGSVNVQRVSEDTWQKIDTGILYLTNKRLIFMGQKGNKTITISKILDFKPFKNGVDIQKESGKSPFLEFDSNVDLFSMILSRLMTN